MASRTVSKPAAKGRKTGTITRNGQTYMVSPISGAECPTGAHPGNTGGKPGRSGRPPNELREAFRNVLPDGIDYIHSVIKGETTITLREKCAHCGKAPKGIARAEDVIATAPTVDNRLRAVSDAARFGLGERSEFSEDVVAANVDRMLGVAESVMSADDFKEYAKQVDVIWNDERRG